MTVVHGGPRHVVTMGDIGLDLGPSGRMACNGTRVSDEAATAAGGLASPSRMLAGHTATAPDMVVYGPSLSWDGPCSPCHGHAGATALMSTRPCVAGTSQRACEASARVPPDRLMEMVGPSSSATVGPATFIGSRPCANSVAIGHDDSGQGPLATGMSSPVKASSGRPLPPQLPAGATTAPWSVVASENQWPVPASPSRVRGAGVPACGIVSTSPPSPAGAAASAWCASPWSPAGTPTADALRSLLRGTGLPSNADLAAQLQAAAPQTYED